MTNNEAPGGRAIVLFSRTWQALTCIRSLGMRGVDVIAADEFSTTPGSLSKYSSSSFEYANPLVDQEQFLQDVSDAVDRFAPADGTPYVLIPTQRETRIIAENAHRFAGRIAIAAPPFDLIEKVSDKGWLARHAAEAGLPVPDTLFPTSRAELEQQLKGKELPVVVKIRSGIGGLGLRLCHSVQEAGATFDEFVEAYTLDEASSPIVQQAVEGQDYCVCIVADKGRAIGTTTYRNVGKLSSGGPGMIRETVSAPQAEEAARCLVSSLNWHGVAQLDFVWTGNSEDPAYLIELNPRLFAGLFQVVASGVDYPWLLYQLAIGESPSAQSPELGIRTETPVLGLLSTLKEAAEELNPGSALELAWKSASKTWQQGQYIDAIQSYIAQLTESSSIDDRLSRVKTLFEEREGNLSEFFDADDPQATIGLLYPLAAYLKYGKLSQDILTGLKAP